MTARQDVFPAASLARMVTVLFPISVGTVADQAAVPLAIPDFPKLVLQVTRATAILSAAVPLSVTELALVDIVPLDGDVMVSAGGVVSGGKSRMSVIVFET